MYVRGLRAGAFSKCLLHDFSLFFLFLMKKIGKDKKMLKKKISDSKRNAKHTFAGPIIQHLSLLFDPLCF